MSYGPHGEQGPRREAVGEVPGPPDERARACPACGVFATRVKGLGGAVTRPRDLAYGESGLEFRWRKRRWWCREPGCPRRSFTEQIPQLPAGARITMRLRGAAGRRIRDAASTVIQAARDLRLSWPTVMDAFRAVAHEVTEAPLPEVKVLGIDETRRGRPRWEQDPATGKWTRTRDRWHTGFVDTLGTGGLLGQVEGRTVAHVLAWLAATPLSWKARRRLLPNREDLTDEQFAMMWNSSARTVAHFVWSVTEIMGPSRPIVSGIHFAGPGCGGSSRPSVRMRIGTSPPTCRCTILVLAVFGSSPSSASRTFSCPRAASACARVVHITTASSA